MDQNQSNGNQLLRASMLGLGGAVLSYYFDPDLGRRRRILLQDKFGKSLRQFRHEGEMALQDMKHRAQGSLHELTARINDREYDDDIIQRRVKAVIGHYCSHPSGIEVEVHDRHVVLRGDILKAEAMPLVWAVSTVRGVKRAHNMLTMHSDTNGVPALQGPAREMSYGLIGREYWPQSYRFVLGGVGALMLSSGLRKGGLKSLVGVTAGGLLLTRAVVNRKLKRIFGVGVGPNAIAVKKAININAPVSKLYEIWTHPENFPSFMRNVYKVESLGDNKFRWTVKGPAGMEIDWTAQMIEKEVNKRLAWHTIPGSLIEQAGEVYFEDHGDSTTVHIQMVYNPPAGAIGHLIAYLFRSDPKTDLDEDMVRMKSMLETGKRPHDSHSKSA